MSVQFTTEKSESKIQRKPIVESGDGRRPGQQDQEAKNPLAAEVAHEEVGEECRTEDDDRVREQREDDRVLERGAEVRVRPLRRVVVGSRRIRPLSDPAVAFVNER